MKASIRVVLGCLVLLACAGRAPAAPDGDLAALSTREYEEYVRERFEWLTGQARSGHRLEARARQDCEPAASPVSDPGRACALARAATEQCDRVVQEGRGLVEGLEQRLGRVPTWARDAGEKLLAAAGRDR
jgi:hypothetical protein